MPWAVPKPSRQSQRGDLEIPTGQSDYASVRCQLRGGGLSTAVQSLAVDPPPDSPPPRHLALKLAYLLRAPPSRVSGRGYGRSRTPLPSNFLSVFLGWEDIVILRNVIELPKVHENWPHGL